jgi:hypothetical protein
VLRDPRSFGDAVTAVPHIFIFVAVGAVVVYLASAFRNDDGPPSNRPITKKHAAAIAHYFMYYNFGRIHQTLRLTLATGPSPTRDYSRSPSDNPIARPSAASRP